MAVSDFSPVFRRKQGWWGGEAGGGEKICTYQEGKRDIKQCKEDTVRDSAGSSSVPQVECVEGEVHTGPLSSLLVLHWGLPPNCPAGDEATDRFKQEGSMMRFVVGNSFHHHAGWEVGGKMEEVRNPPWWLSWSKIVTWNEGEKAIWEMTWRRKVQSEIEEELRVPFLELSWSSEICDSRPGPWARARAPWDTEPSS